MYHIRILKSASRDLAHVDKSIGRRIVERINWLAENLDVIPQEPLKANGWG
jgi:mRNA-degrading endonuclease RelE of RelBE toxin-antitoxin system